MDSARVPRFGFIRHFWSYFPNVGRCQDTKICESVTPREQLEERNFRPMGNGTGYLDTEFVK